MRKLSAVLFALILSAASLHAADNYLGTWILNLAKSKYDPGPGPKSQTTKLEMVGGNLREVVERVNQDGTTTRWDYAVKTDGKDHAITGDPDRDTVAIKRIDDNTIEVVNKKAGKITTSMVITVSKDGKSRTNAVKGTNAKGAAINHVLFFDRK